MTIPTDRLYGLSASEHTSAQGALLKRRFQKLEKKLKDQTPTDSKLESDKLTTTQIEAAKTEILNKINAVSAAVASATANPAANNPFRPEPNNVTTGGDESFITKIENDVREIASYEHELLTPTTSHRNAALWNILNAMVIAGLFSTMGVLGMHGVQMSPHFFGIALGTETAQFAIHDLPDAASRNRYQGAAGSRTLNIAKLVFPMMMIGGAIGTAVLDKGASSAGKFITTAPGAAGSVVGGLFFIALMTRFAYMARAIHQQRKELAQIEAQLVKIKDRMSEIASELKPRGSGSGSSGTGHATSSSPADLRVEYKALKTTFVTLRKKAALTKYRINTLVVQAALVLGIAAVVATLFIMPHLGAAVTVAAVTAHKMMIAGGAAGGILGLWTALRMKFGFGKSHLKRIDAEADKAFGSDQSIEADNELQVKEQTATHLSQTPFMGRLEKNFDQEPSADGELTPL